TIAVGWTLAMNASVLDLDVADRSHELRFRHELFAHGRLGRELEHASHDVELDRLEHELVAREHRTLEAGVVDAREEEQRALVVTFSPHHVGEDCRYLRHRFDDQHAREHRVTRKVALEEGLVEGHVLDRLDALAGDVALQHAIDHEKRISMRQVPHDLDDVHRWHAQTSSLPAARSRARNRSTIERSRRMAEA